MLRFSGWSLLRLRSAGAVLQQRGTALKSLKKKYKDKKFAAGCSREVIERGAELCGLTLEELWQQTLDAMRSCEDSINRQMEEI